MGLYSYALNDTTVHRDVSVYFRQEFPVFFVISFCLFFVHERIIYES